MGECVAVPNRRVSGKVGSVRSASVRAIWTGPTTAVRRRERLRQEKGPGRDRVGRVRPAPAHKPAPGACEDGFDPPGLATDGPRRVVLGGGVRGYRKRIGPSPGLAGPCADPFVYGFFPRNEPVLPPPLPGPLRCKADRPRVGGGKLAKGSRLADGVHAGRSYKPTRVLTRRASAGLAGLERNRFLDEGLRCTRRATRCLAQPLPPVAGQCPPWLDSFENSGSPDHAVSRPGTGDDPRRGNGHVGLPVVPALGLSPSSLLLRCPGRLLRSGTRPLAPHGRHGP